MWNHVTFVGVHRAWMVSSNCGSLILQKEWELLYQVADHIGMWLAALEWVENCPVMGLFRDLLPCWSGHFLVWCMLLESCI